MSKPLHKTTLHTWGHWAAYILLAVLGFCTGRYSWRVPETVSVVLPGFPGPIAPGAVMLLTTQLYGMLFLLILLILSRNFFPTAAPFITALIIGFLGNALMEAGGSAYIHLYEGLVHGPL